MGQRQCTFGVPVTIGRERLLAAVVAALGSLRSAHGPVGDVDVMVTSDVDTARSGLRGFALVTAGPGLDHAARAAFLERLVGIEGLPALRVLVDEVTGLSLVDGPDPVGGAWLTLASDGEELVGDLSRLGAERGGPTTDPHAAARLVFGARFPRARHPDALLDLFTRAGAWAVHRDGAPVLDPVPVCSPPGWRNLFPWWPSDDDWDDAFHADARDRELLGAGMWQRAVVLDAGSIEAALEHLLHGTDPRTPTGREASTAAHRLVARQVEAAVAAYQQGAADHVAARAICERSLGAAWSSLGDARRAIEHYERALALGADPSALQADIGLARQALSR